MSENKSSKNEKERIPLEKHEGVVSRSIELAPSPERFNAFSDGVFAIAITLLVIDLPVPPADTPVLHTLLRDWHEFLGYLISFTFIGSIWLTHAGISRVLKRSDSIILGVNLLVLLFVTTLPFSTKLMVTHLESSDVIEGVLFYGVNLLFASLSLNLLLFYIVREPLNLSTVLAEQELKRLYRRRWLALGINAFAILIALFSPRVAVGLYVAQTAIVLVIPLYALHRHKRVGFAR